MMFDKQLFIKNKYWLMFTLVIIVSIIPRVFFMDRVSLDASMYLIPWFHDIKEAGGIMALDKQVGDYNIIYQTLIALMTYLPIKDLYSYKLLSIVFDYLLAAAVAKVVYKISNGDLSKSLIAFSLVVLSPLVIMNSAWWAQCDSIYVFFCIGCIYYILEDKYKAAMLMLGFSFAFKLQTVFMLPFIGYCFLKKKEFKFYYFFLVLVPIVASGIPAFAVGRNFKDIFMIYFKQTTLYKSMYMNYPSFWAIFGDSGEAYYNQMKVVTIVVTFVLLLAILGVCLIKKAKFNSFNNVLIAFAFAYTCVFFLPSMHDRYGFLYEILALIILIFKKRTAALLVPMYGITAVTYLLFLNLRIVDMTAFGFMELIIYLTYMIVVVKSVEFCKEETVTD